MAGAVLRWLYDRRQSAGGVILPFSMGCAGGDHLLAISFRIGWRDGRRFHIAIDAWKGIQAGADPTPRTAASVRRGMARRGAGSHLSEETPGRRGKGTPLGLCGEAGYLGVGR
jgi:hypothetical protein